ncbi:MAG: 30S ribosomal protein S15 [Bacteroidia bacterium]|nr:30S ribosomal protein S15 [Bacteroidia bacterium]
MYLYKELKQEIFEKYGFEKRAEDTGSSESQIALFTYRIQHLTEHLKQHKKDKSTQIGLQRLVGKRRKLLNYLMHTDVERYRAVIKELGIRK